MTLSYEDQRAQNIADNEALLKSLGLDVPQKLGPKPATPTRKPRTKGKAPTRASTRPKRRADDDYEDGAESSESDLDYAPAPRRLARAPAPRSDSGRKNADEPQRKAERLGERTQDPKTFGSIPGVPVGTWWASRMACSTAAIHAPTVAGISGDSELGAWSVALSGGYPDDVDLGEAFTYTGSGGRDLKGTKQNPKNLRTAPQTYDQSFDNRFNASLKASSITKNPVRVIRGFKLDSVYAPAEGYRYDGLYVVERAWMAPGLTNGLKVCKYAFKRLPGQPPLPRNDGPQDVEEEDAVEAEVEDDDDEVDENASVEAEEKVNGYAKVNVNGEADESEADDDKPLAKRRRSGRQADKDDKPVAEHRRSSRRVKAPTPPSKPSTPVRRTRRSLA